MRTKINTLSRVINFSNPSMNLPCNALLDAVALKFSLTVSNGNTTTAKTPTITDILTAIQEIKLTTDSTNVHYSVNGLDLARINAFDGHEGSNAVINKTLSSIAASGTGTVDFVLFLDQGDILAAQYDTIELKALFKQTAFATDLTITAATVTVTTVEIILTEEELQATYGKNLEYFAEPKVIGSSKTNSANTEMTPFFEIPTGSLSKRAFLTFSTVPDKIGIVATNPDLQNLLDVDWATFRAMDGFKSFCNGSCPSNTILLDYGSQLAANGQGIYGWNFRLGDYMVAAKNSSETTMRYVSVELIPKNQAKFEELGVLETEYGF